MTDDFDLTGVSETDIAVVGMAAHLPGAADIGQYWANLRDGVTAGEPDDDTRYYEHWLAALERLKVSKLLVDTVGLSRCKLHWEAAHLVKPNRRPVELARS